VSTLTSSISESETDLSVTDPIETLIQGDVLRIGDEAVLFLGYTWDATYRGANRRGRFTYTTWNVQRGYLGSTAATHAGGTEIMAANDAFVAAEDLTTPSPFTSSGGSGLPDQWAVDDDGGLVINYEDTQGSVPAVQVNYVGDPTDYIPLLQLGTDDAPAFTIDSTADADVRFRDSGVSWIWHDAPGGLGHVVKIGAEDVTLGSISGFLQVIYGDQLYVLGATGIVFQIVFATGAVLLPNLPTSDPGVAGQLFSDGVPSAGTPKALMVSGG
jgi:hypothetical protein